MWPLTYYPLYVFIVSLSVLWGAVWVGGSLLVRYKREHNWSQQDFNIVQTTTLTLLGLIIGFTFSMAIGRYDQRKVLEEAEANAIGTAYLRADLLPEAIAPQVRSLLKQYAAQRILFYTTDEETLTSVNTSLSKVQQELWSAVTPVAVSQPTPLMVFVVSGLNDVFNAQGHSQGASWNHIPRPAWLLLAVIAICANILIGFGARKFNNNRELLFILPLVISITFFLIADIDSPRGGVIRVDPQNLQSLMQSLP